jgi:hypothetical protein
MESTEIFVPFEPLDQNGLTYSNDTELPDVEFQSHDPGSIVFSPFPGYEGSGFVVIAPHSPPPPMTNPTPTPQPADPVAWCRSDDFRDSLLTRMSLVAWREPHPDCDMPLYAQPQASAIAPDADQAEGPSLADVDELCAEFGFHLSNDTYTVASLETLRDVITAAITRWPLPALQPPVQPVSLAELHDPDFSGGLTPSQHLAVVHGGAYPRVVATAAQAYKVLEDRYEFSVVNSDDCEVAGGSAPTLDDAIREGRNYLRQYNQDGPHKLELRRVLVLDHSEATHG